MGGYGAALIGFRHPELFGGVSILTGALHSPQSLHDQRRSIFDAVYRGDMDYAEAHSPWSVLRENATRRASNRQREESFIRRPTRIIVFENIGAARLRWLYFWWAPGGKRLDAPTSVGFGEAVERVVGSNVELAVDDRDRGLRAFVHRVDRKKLPLGAGADNGDFALLAHRVNLPVRGDGGRIIGTERAAQSSPLQNLPRVGVERRQDAPFFQRVEHPTIVER
ncbi:MAG: hypothetical protein E2P02_20230 [Acidobacteria bacterium]|nr:MAG: hypothetical protein E2P02_20230 [Acidobacteriota bacterium]